MRCENKKATSPLGEVAFVLRTGIEPVRPFLATGFSYYYSFRYLFSL